MVVSSCVGVGIKPGSSTRATSSLNHYSSWFYQNDDFFFFTKWMIIPSFIIWKIFTELI